MYLLKNRVLDKNFFLFGSFSFLADKKKAAQKDGVNPDRIRSLGEILGPDEPIGPPVDVARSRLDGSRKVCLVYFFALKERKKVNFDTHL